MILKTKPIRTAFLISASVHIFLLFFVTIVVLPANFRIIKPSTVSFLGPILEKAAFEMMLDQKGEAAKAQAAESAAPVSVLLNRDAGRELGALKFENIFSSTSNPEDRDMKPAYSDKLFGDFKFVPAFDRGQDETGQKVSQPVRPGDYAGKKDKAFQVQGRLANRAVLLKPEQPVIEKTIDRQQNSFIVELRFKVLSDGTVDDAVLLASSGYPDVDLAAINYVKGFRFAAAGYENTGKSEWGRIRLDLKGR